MGTDAMNYCTSCSLGHTIICFLAALIFFLSGMVTLGKWDDDCDDTRRHNSTWGGEATSSNDCESDFVSLPTLLLTFSAVAFVIGLLLVCLTVKLNRTAARQIIKTTTTQSGTEAGVGRSDAMGTRMTRSPIGNGLRQNNQTQNMRHPQVATISGGGESSSGFAMQPTGYSSEALGLPPPYSSVVSKETKPTQIFGHCSPSAPAMIDGGLSSDGAGFSSSGIGYSDSGRGGFSSTGGGFSSSNGAGCGDSGTGFSSSAGGFSSSTGGGCSDSGGGCSSGSGGGCSSSDW